MHPITVTLGETNLQLTADDELPDAIDDGPDAFLTDKDNNVRATVIVWGDSFAVQVRALDGDQRDRDLELRIKETLRSKLEDKGLRKEFDLEEEERSLGYIGSLNFDYFEGRLNKSDTDDE